MTSRGLARWLGVAVAVIAGLGLGVEIWHSRSHAAAVEALLPRLSLSYEANVPTWFASSLLLVCALAAAVIAREAPAWRRHWAGVVAVFGYASLDEATQLHEHLGGNFDTGGVLYFDWVIPAVAILGVLALGFLPFVRALTPATRRRLIVAGVIYVGGAVAMELPLGWWTERAGPESFGYALIDWVEETLELVGASLALLAFVKHREAVA
ncbi:MAG: hypothetical protein H0X17_20270 [Deltaproteobacteria bacterium]|nr:hypothetical protein [Deltaproteobacteria bacterium]